MCKYKPNRGLELEYGSETNQTLAPLVAGIMIGQRHFAWKFKSNSSDMCTSQFYLFLYVRLFVRIFRCVPRYYINRYQLKSTVDSTLPPNENSNIGLVCLPAEIRSKYFMIRHCTRFYRILGRAYESSWLISTAAGLLLNCCCSHCFGLASFPSNWTIRIRTKLIVCKPKNYACFINCQKTLLMRSLVAFVCLPFVSRHQAELPKLVANLTPCQRLCCCWF